MVVEMHLRKPRRFRTLIRQEKPFGLSPIEDLQDGPKDPKDVIGYATVINGKVNNADVYASHSLFHKLWAKLLNASAIEAADSRASRWKRCNAPVPYLPDACRLGSSEAVSSPPQFHEPTSNMWSKQGRRRYRTAQKNMFNNL